MSSVPVMEARPATLANWPHWLGPQSRSSRAMTCNRLGLGSGVRGRGGVGAGIRLGLGLGFCSSWVISCHRSPHP